MVRRTVTGTGPFLGRYLDMTLVTGDPSYVTPEAVARLGGKTEAG